MQRTIECSLSQLETELRNPIENFINSEEKIVACFKTEWHMVWVQVITNRQVIVLNAPYLQSILPFRKPIIDSPVLRHIDFQNINKIVCNKNEDYDLYTVKITGSDNREIDTHFITQQKANLFFNILENTISVMKEHKTGDGAHTTRRLKELSELYENDLITKDEFDKKKKDILSRL